MSFRGVFVYLFCFCMCFITMAQDHQPSGFKLSANEVISLQAEWNYAPGQLVPPDSVAAINWETVHVPQSVSSSFYSKALRAASYGVATYYTTVQLDEKRNDIAIYLPTQGTAYRLFVNRQLIGEVGRVATSKEEAKAHYQPVVFELALDTNYFEILIHLSNHHYHKSGLWHYPEIGSAVAMITKQQNYYLRDIFVIGAILMLALYQLGTNFPGFKNKASYLFIFICLGSILRISCQSNYTLALAFPSMSWFSMLKIELSSFYIMVGFSALFIYEVFKPFGLHRFAFLSFFYFYLILISLTLLLPVEFSSYFVPIGQFTAILIFIYSISYLAFPAYKGHTESIIFISTALIVCVILLAYMLEIVNQNTIHKLSLFAVLIYIMGLSTIIARRHSSIFKELEQSKIALDYRVTHLNEEIEKRTEALKSQVNLLDIKNKELENTNNDLDELIAEKDGLVGVVAHDLKSPLSRNIGVLNLLEMEEELSEGQKNVVKKMIDNNQQGLNLIKDLLHIYAFESNYKLVNSHVNIQQLLQTISNQFAHALQEKNQHLATASNEFTTLFYTDYSLLTKIIERFLTNAIAYSPKGKTIWLNVKKIGETLHIEVKDEGPGISEEEQRMLFKKFQPLSNRPTDGSSTAGLGLYIVKQIVKRLEGKIKVYSKVGRGSTFKVELKEWQDTNDDATIAVR